MKVTTHELSPIAIACGVTLEQVAEELPKARFDFDRGTAYLGWKVGPALAAEVARCGLDDPHVEYVGHNQIGEAVYRSMSGQ